VLPFVHRPTETLRRYVREILWVRSQLPRVQLLLPETELADYGFKGKEECEDGAGMTFALTAADVEGSAVAFDDFVTDPEAKAGSSDVLGGEEGLEYFCGGLGGHS
jgi:hypothetical protein